MILHSRPFVTDEDRLSIAQCLENKNLNTGFYTAPLHDYFSVRFQKGNFKLVTSGSAAFFLILKILDLQEGDEILLPTYVCHKVFEAIKRAGGTPVLCDIGAADWCITVEAARRHKTPRTKAVVLVNTFGHLVDIQSFKELDLPFILDCCHDFHTIHNFQERSVSFDYVDFLFASFNATKPLTSGTGGLAMCVNKNYESSFQKTSVLWNDMFEMNDLQRSLLWTQLNQYDNMSKRKKDIAEIYLKELPPFLIRHYESLNPSFRFLLIQDFFSFEDVQKRYEAQGIHVRRGVDCLLHREYTPPHHFPVAEEMFKKTVSIPFYPSLKDDDVHHVVRVTKDIFRSW